MTKALVDINERLDISEMFIRVLRPVKVGLDSR